MEKINQINTDRQKDVQAEKQVNRQAEAIETEKEKLPNRNEVRQKKIKAEINTKRRKELKRDINNDKLIE